MDMKVNKGLKGQFIVLFIIFSISISLSIGIFTYIVNYREVYDTYLDLGRNCANMASGIIDHENIQSFLLEGKNEIYEQEKEIINKIVESYSLTCIYVFVPDTEKNSITYIYDCMSKSTNIELMSDLGEEIEDVGLYEQYLSMYQGENDKSELDISNDEYGYLASTYIPIKKSDGEIVALIGVDMSMTDILKTVRVQTILLILISVICVVVFAIILLIVINKRIVEPIKMISYKMDDFVKQDHKGLDLEPIVLKREDELELVTNSFNKMVDNINNYIDNITSITAEKEKISSELNVAKRIQESLLPCIFPAFPNRKEIDIFALMIPAKEVGGDFYDFFFIDDDNIVFLVADVSGKGVSASLFMVIAKTLLKNDFNNGNSLDKVFEKLNNQLNDNNTENMFVTSFAAVFNLKTGKLICVNAGHGNPLIYRKKNKKFEWLDEEINFVLAGYNDIKYKTQETYLDKGDLIYIYTDGVTEAMNEEGMLFSDERLINTLNSFDILNMNVTQITNGVLDEIKKFAGDALQADDITMLTFKNREVEYRVKGF